MPTQTWTGLLDAREVRLMLASDGVNEDSSTATLYVDGYPPLQLEFVAPEEDEAEDRPQFVITAKGKGDGDDNQD